MISRWIVVSLVLIGTAACVIDIAAPPRVPRVRVISDIARTDTIDAEPPSRMVIEVSDSSGRLSHSVTVSISGIQSTVGSQQLQMFPIDISRTQTGTITTVTSGDVAFFVKFGEQAGRAGIVVSVHALQLTDTLWFEVNPGAPAHIRLEPGDTAVVLGESFTQDASVIDRGGNDLNLRPTFASADPALTVSPAGNVTANAYARAGVTATYAAPKELLRETAMVSVVPRGRVAQGIAAAGTSVTSAIGIRSTNGSLIHSYPTPQAPFRTEWSPDGLRVYYVGSGSSSTDQRLYALTLADGSTRPVVSDTVSVLSGQLLDWPAPSPDGVWLYFSAHQIGGNSSVWRIHPDGGGAQQLASVPPVGSGDFLSSPSPSGDGSRIAYVEKTYSANDVKVLDLATGNTTTIRGTGADEVRWSPNGERLATRGGAGLYVVNADGTALNQLVSSISFFGGLDWSPDGLWILVRIQSVPNVVDPVTGLLLPTPLYGAGLTWSTN